MGGPGALNRRVKVAATITKTEETIHSVKKIRYQLTADSAGTVASTTSSAQTSNAFDGVLQALATIGASGGSAPSANWDVWLYDGSSVDVLMGGGTSRAAGTELTKSASLGAVAGDKLTIKASGMGGSNKASVIVYIR
jgi:hypothetical protein